MADKVTLLGPTSLTPEVVLNEVASQSPESILVVFVDENGQFRCLSSHMTHGKYFALIGFLMADVLPYNGQ